MIREASNKLTPRRLAYLELVAEGLTRAEIAERLGVTRDTAKNTLWLVYGILGVRCGAHAVALGFRRGLLR